MTRVTVERAWPKDWHTRCSDCGIVLGLDGVIGCHASWEAALATANHHLIGHEMVGRARSLARKGT